MSPAPADFAFFEMPRGKGLQVGRPTVWEALSAYIRQQYSYCLPANSADVALQDMEHDLAIGEHFTIPGVSAINPPSRAAEFVVTGQLVASPKGQGLQVERDDSTSRVAINTGRSDSAIILAALQLLGVLAAGEQPSQADAEAIQFHLDSLREELALLSFPRQSPSQMAHRLAERIAPMYGVNWVPWITWPLKPEWQGMPLASVWPWHAILSATYGLDLSECEEELIRFYAGDQWDVSVQRERAIHQRPTLVLNMLPTLVAASIAASSETISQTAAHRLKLVITHQNADAQRAYNYACSAAVEQQRRPAPYLYSGQVGTGYAQQFLRNPL